VVASRQADSTITAALAHAGLGEPVLPLWWTDSAGACQCASEPGKCKPGKHPLTPNGFYDATTDEREIRAWYKKWPKANLGARTEFVPRVDIDLPDVAEALSSERSLALQTRLVHTPHEGLHIAFWTPEPVESAVLYLKDGRRLGELKASGGYVVVPPSAIGKRPYTLLSPSDVGLLQAEPTAWLASLLPQFGFSLDLQRTQRRRDYEALAGLIHEGEGRHNALLSYAGRIWFKGIASETFIALLREINERQCSPPLPDDELIAIAYHYVNRREQSALLIPGDNHDDAAVSRVRPGGSAILDAPTETPALWGEGEAVLAAQGEPTMIYGPTGIGKGTLSQQLVLASIGIRPPELLGLPVSPRQRWLYLALDRPAQIKRSFRRMVRDDQRSVLDERLVIHDGPLDFDLAREPERLLDLAREVGADGLVIDSLKDAAAGLEKPEVGQLVNKAHQLLVANGVDLIINHHPRKAQVGNSKPKAIDDVFGSRFIADGCGSVILLWGSPGDAVVDLSHLKQPRDSVGPWTLIHDHDAGETRLEEKIDALTVINSANGISAEGIARKLFRTENPARAQVENARRKAQSLVKKGLAHERPGTSGGKDGGAPSLFFKVDTVHAPFTTPRSADSRSVHAPTNGRSAHESTEPFTEPDETDSESVHDSAHGVHEATVHDSAPLYREGGREGMHPVWEKAIT
jgi:hypothetical protein